jgi:hypothetical protein
MDKVNLEHLFQIVDRNEFLDQLTETVFINLLSYLKDQEALIKKLEDKKNEEA